MKADQLEVYLSPLAAYKLDLLIEYLDEKWGDKACQNFLKRFKNKVSQISSFPKSFPESGIRKGIYKVVVSDNTSMYYRIQPESVEIITVIDNRQNPEKTAKEINRYF